MFQGLGLSAFTAKAQVQSLVGELGFGKSHGVARKKEKTLCLKHEVLIGVYSSVAWGWFW